MNATPSALDLEANALLQQKEQQAKLGKDIEEKTETVKNLDAEIARKEWNEKALTEKNIQLDKDLTKKTEDMKKQQEMVSSAVKEKNEKMAAKQIELDERDAEISAREDKIETRENKIASASDSFKKKEDELSLREYEVAGKEKSVEEQIKALSKTEKDVKAAKKTLESEKKAISAATAENKKSIANLKKIEEGIAVTSQENQAIIKTLQAEKSANASILSCMDTVAADIKRASIAMMQQFQRLVAKSGTDFPYQDLVNDETAEAIGISLLKWVYQDKNRMEQIIEKLGLGFVSEEKYSNLNSEYLSVQNELLRERGKITDDDNTGAGDLTTGQQSDGSVVIEWTEVKIWTGEDTGAGDDTEIDMTVAELKKALTDMEIEFPKSANKAALIEIYKTAINKNVEDEQ